MSKLVLDNQVPDKYDRQIFSGIVRAICNQANLHAEGKISGRYQAQSAQPGSSVAAQVSDITWNLNATVVNGTITGSLVGNYIVVGWICTVSDPVSPTWKELRIPTP